MISIGDRFTIGIKAITNMKVLMFSGYRADGEYRVLKVTEAHLAKRTKKCSTADSI